MTLTFDKIILRPLLDRLKSQALVAYTTQHDNRDCRAGGVNLPDRRKTERIWERQVQEHGIESLTTQTCKPFCQCPYTGNLELLAAPFRKKILRKLSVNVIIFDEKHLDHLTPLLSLNL